MRIQTNVIIIIGLVLVLVLSGTAFNTFSFAASTNNATSQSTSTTNNTTKVPSQMMTTTTTTTNPIVQNSTNSLIGSPYTTCTGTDAYLWNHVYNVKNGQPWGQDPGRLRITQDPQNPQYKYGSCVTVTGQVYSQTSTGGTKDEPDGDLHFTLALDKQYWGLSNPKDPECKPSAKYNLPPGCMNIIVEIICHKTPANSYLQHGDYCKDVKNNVYSGVPNLGDKLKVSGKLVLDEGEGKWNEIHPASYVHSFP
jgi:hypothetical protein